MEKHLLGGNVAPREVQPRAHRELDGGEVIAIALRPSIYVVATAQETLQRPRPVLSREAEGMRTHIAGGKWAEVAIIAQPSLGIGVRSRIIDTSEVSLMEERKPVGLPSPLGRRSAWGSPLLESG